MEEGAQSPVSSRSFFCLSSIVSEKKKKLATLMGFPQVYRILQREHPSAIKSVVDDFYVAIGLTCFSVWRTRRGICCSSPTASHRYVRIRWVHPKGMYIERWKEVLQDVLPEDLAIQPLHNVQDEQVIFTLGLL